MFNRKGTLSEIIGLFLFVIVFFAAGSAIAGLVDWGTSRVEVEDVSSIDSFDNLVDEINEVLNRDDIFTYEENIQFYLNYKFMIIGFDDSSFELSLKGDKIIINKPTIGECREHCLCLYKFDGRWRKFEKTKEIIKCAVFDADVNFYSPKSSEFESSTTYSSVANFHNPMFYSSKVVDVNEIFESMYGQNQVFDYTTGLMKDVEWYENDFVPFGFSGRAAIGADATKEDDGYTSNVGYIDIIDMSRLRNSDNRKVVFISPMMRYEVANQTVVDKNIILRTEHLPNIAHKPYQDYATRIIDTGRNDMKLYYFLEYYWWANNDLLFDSTRADENVRNLGATALEEVKFAVLDRIDYCSKLPSNFSCVKEYIDDCNVDYMPNNETCNLVMKDPVQILPINLSKKLTDWMNKMDPSGELKRKIEEAKLLEANSYNEAYQEYLKIIDDEFTDANGTIDYAKLGNSKLFFMRSALELKNSNYTLVGRNFSNGENIYQINVSNESRYLFIPLLSKLIVSGAQDISKNITFDELASPDGVLIDNIQTKQEKSRELIYIALAALNIFDNEGCIVFTAQDFTFTESADAAACQSKFLSIGGGQSGTIASP